MTAICLRCRLPECDAADRACLIRAGNAAYMAKLRAGRRAEITTADRAAHSAATAAHRLEMKARRADG